MSLFRKLLSSKRTRKGPEVATPAATPTLTPTAETRNPDPPTWTKFPDHCIPESHILTCGHRLGTEYSPLPPTICTLSCKEPIIKPRNVYPDISSGESAGTSPYEEEDSAELRLRNFGPDYLICDKCYEIEQSLRFYFFMQDAGPNTARWIKRVAEPNPIKVHGYPTLLTVSCRTKDRQIIGGSFPASIVESYERGGPSILAQYASHFINRTDDETIPPNVHTDRKAWIKAPFKAQRILGKGEFRHLLREIRIPRQRKAKTTRFAEGENQVRIIEQPEHAAQGFRHVEGLPEILTPGRRDSDASSLNSQSSQDSLDGLDAPMNRLGHIAKMKDIDFGGKSTGKNEPRRESFDSETSQITQASDTLSGDDSVHSFSTPTRQPDPRRGSRSSVSTISTVSSAGSAAELFLEITLSRDTAQSRGRNSRRGSETRTRSRSSSTRSLGLLPNDAIPSRLSNLQARLDALNEHDRRSRLAEQQEAGASTALTLISLDKS